MEDAEGGKIALTLRNPYQAQILPLLNLLTPRSHV